MWSSNTYKYLLFLLATSQVLLLMLFWRQTLQYEGRGLTNIGRRSNNDCLGGDRSLGSKRFNVGNNSTKRVFAADIEDTNHTELKRENFDNTLGWKTTSQSKFSGDYRPVLLIAVMSAREYNERRQAIRETWFQECHSSLNVVCKFFTDAQDGRGDPIDDEIIKDLSEESANNRGDLVLLNTPSGTNFSLRLLALFEWANRSLKFDYLLRIDDDQFLCLERLLAELPYRPRKRLYWGYTHCHQGMFHAKTLCNH